MKLSPSFGLAAKPMTFSARPREIRFGEAAAVISKAVSLKDTVDLTALPPVADMKGAIPTDYYYGLINLRALLEKASPEIRSLAVPVINQAVEKIWTEGDGGIYPFGLNPASKGPSPFTAARFIRASFQADVIVNVSRALQPLWDKDFKGKKGPSVDKTQEPATPEVKIPKALRKEAKRFHDQLLEVHRKLTNEAISITERPYVIGGDEDTAYARSLLSLLPKEYAGSKDWRVRFIKNAIIEHYKLSVMMAYATMEFSRVAKTPETEVGQPGSPTAEEVAAAKQSMKRNAVYGPYLRLASLLELAADIFRHRDPRPSAFSWQGFKDAFTFSLEDKGPYADAQKALLPIIEKQAKRAVPNSADYPYPGLTKVIEVMGKLLSPHKLGYFYRTFTTKDAPERTFDALSQPLFRLGRLWDPETAVEVALTKRGLLPPNAKGEEVKAALAKALPILPIETSPIAIQTAILKERILPTLEAMSQQDGYGNYENRFGAELLSELSGVIAQAEVDRLAEVTDYFLAQPTESGKIPPAGFYHMSGAKHLIQSIQEAGSLDLSKMEPYFNQLIGALTRHSAETPASVRRVDAMVLREIVDKLASGPAQDESKANELLIGTILPWLEVQFTKAQTSQSVMPADVGLSLLQPIRKVAEAMINQDHRLVASQKGDEPDAALVQVMQAHQDLLRRVDGLAQSLTA
ncbi:MAG: hypothetical protein K2X01_05060 [Cyanobacteria bacterium]|nr:hypothetical protein [Cyanobacteriota bacterium]